MWALPVSIVVTVVLISIPLSQYMARIMDGRYRAPRLLRWAEARLDSGPQDWKQYTAALLAFSLVLFVFGFAVLALQPVMPLNPEGKYGMLAPSMIFNTVASFMTNTNLQHYSGDVHLSNFTQLLFLVTNMFVSASIGLCALTAIIRAFRGEYQVGNFFVDMWRVLVYMFVPVCLISGTLFIAGGMDGTWTAGTDFIKIDTGAGTTASPNGLATPIPVDIDGDDVVDYIYAGDLQGNLWKFDVKDSSPTAWKVAFGTTSAPLPLFTAVDGEPTPNPQPITSAPTVTPHPEGGFMVNFGTGKYLEVNDIDPNKVPYKTQTLYGVWDKDDGSTTITGRTELVEQTVLSTLTTASGQKFRITSQNPVNFNSQKGWYLDLPSSSTTGERVAYNPLLRFGRSVFTTLIPSSSPCDFGGISWLMELDYLTGGRLNGSPFDANGDKKFNEADLQELTTGSGTIKAAVSGVQLGSSVGGGIAPTPTIIKGCKGGECKEANLSSGTIEGVGESVPPGEQGRINWRELIK